MIQRSQGYEYLRCYVKFAYWLTHKKITVTGLENIPTDKPVIFAANHQNALMDPLALVCSNKLQTVWLTRADVFKGKTIRSLLEFMKMSPVYRIRDGKENLGNNEQVFRLVTSVLEKNLSIALFPEAAHSGRRQMLGHKKAIPRMALEAEEKNNFQLDLKLVPVGIYYDHYWKFNRSVIVQYGPPLDIDPYKERFVENPQNTMLVMRDDIYRQLVPLVLQINSDKYYAEYENIRSVAGNEFTNKVIYSRNREIQLFKSEQDLIAKIEQIETAQPEIFEKILDRVGLYVRGIDKIKVTDSQLLKGNKTSFLVLFLQSIAALLSLPIFAVGFAFNFIPYFIPRLFITNKLKDKAFVSSFNFAVGLVLFPVFYLIEFGLILGFTGSALAAITSLIFMPFAGKIAFNLFEFYWDLAVVMKLKLFFRKKVNSLLESRNSFIQLLKMHAS